MQWAAPAVPGVYTQQIETPANIEAVPTAITAFVGRTASGPLDRIATIQSLAEYERTFGAVSAAFPLSYAVRDFFKAGGDQAIIARVKSAADLPGSQNERTGIYLLEQAGMFNILCIPPDTLNGDTPAQVYRQAADYCAQRYAFLILDPPVAWSAAAKAGDFNFDPSSLGIDSTSARFAAIYFPRIVEDGVTVPASGAIAGIFAANDKASGVWRSPANAMFPPGTAVELDLSGPQNGMLSARGINCLRKFGASSPLVWGARTLRGADAFNDDFKYVSVRRLTSYIEQSVLLGTRFAVFQPNDEALRAQLRLLVESFMANLSRLGAVYNFNVECESDGSVAAENVARGLVEIRILFAPLKPEEFLQIVIMQQAGQSAA